MVAPTGFRRQSSKGDKVEDDVKEKLEEAFPLMKWYEKGHVTETDI